VTDAIQSKAYLKNRGIGMTSQRLLAEIAREERLQEWMRELERRILVERRTKVSAALRSELEMCKARAIAIQEAIACLQEDESESQAS
jgi:arsenate reductase-like glutaredoxin family protein